jgi:hypothetical protein
MEEVAPTRSFIICTHLQTSFGRSSQVELGGQGVWYAWERREKCTRFWWQSPREIDLSEDQDVDERMGLEWILWRLAGGGWIGFDWLRMGTGGKLLWVRWWTLGFLRHGVGWSVGWLFGWSVGPFGQSVSKSVSRSVGQSVSQSVS